MKIVVSQVSSEKNNEFEIKYNDDLKYKAILPFVSINDGLNVEKLRSIRIFDLDGKQLYKTDYNYLENLKEEFIPMKFLVTGSQKFNQLVFSSDKNTYKIYYEENEIWNNRYVIEINDKKYYCYSIEDGYVRHFPIYDGETQIGEALKSNVVIDHKDEYYCYLKHKYEDLSDGIMVLFLYLDRCQYSSSYLIDKSYSLEKKYSYNKTNKYYDKNWVKNNFGDAFYKKVNKDVAFVKEKLSHPIKTSIEQFESLPKEKKISLEVILITPFVLMFIGLIITLLVILISGK